MLAAIFFIIFLIFLISILKYYALIPLTVLVIGAYYQFKKTDAKIEKEMELERPTNKILERQTAEDANKPFLTGKISWVNNKTGKETHLADIVVNLKND
ncbi:hypothetical protein [Pasteurella multocida]|uniref:hypothetical protein n=1 Tax=Pasteurella multocida TaxID=747 RepID=UPI00021458B6|nr:hypothetical protein [Pasteurella multocida]AWB52522.1 hypothetical protein DB278_02955 [Pasteurella multocida]EGP02908.1 hypothetical protein GEW_12796 [Pasteurella multocida subsp. gallicida str. Anand1_poultry]